MNPLWLPCVRNISFIQKGRRFVFYFVTFQFRWILLSHHIPLEGNIGNDIFIAFFVFLVTLEMNIISKYTFHLQSVRFVALVMSTLVFFTSTCVIRKEAVSYYYYCMFLERSNSSFALKSMQIDLLTKRSSQLGKTRTRGFAIVCKRCWGLGFAQCLYTKKRNKMMDL